METRATQPVSAVPLAPARLDAAPVRAAVRTDLTPPKAVSAQAGSEQTRFSRDRRSEDPSDRQTKSSFAVDRETGELVYQVIDQETENVLSQYPYDSLLRLRAYIRSNDEQGES
jgi:hypothetical protein